VQGHEVDGIPLCTPSVYADIALSLGTYLLERYRPDQQESLVDVSDMTISKAMILRAGATQQLLQAHAEVDWSSNAAAIKFMSFDVSVPLHLFSSSLPDGGLIELITESAETTGALAMRCALQGQKPSAIAPK